MFEQTVAGRPETRDWDAWVLQYTPDVDYIEHATGTMKGRDEVRAWITKTMTHFPGQPHDGVPVAVVGDRRADRPGHLRAGQPDARPRRRHASSAPPTSRSSPTPATGCGRRQEDIYNPLRFVQAAMKWCQQGAGARHARRRGGRAGCAQYGGCSSEHQPKLVIGANGFLGSHVTRQLVADGARGAGHGARTPTPSPSTTSTCTRFIGDIFDNDTLREAMAGCDDVYYCVVDTRAWLRDPAPLFRTNVEGTRNVLEVAERTRTCAGSSSPAPTRRSAAGAATWPPRTT